MIELYRVVYSEPLQVLNHTEPVWMYFVLAPTRAVARKCAFSFPLLASESWKSVAQRTLVEDMDRHELDAVARLGAQSQRATPVALDVVAEWQVLRPDGQSLDLDELERWVSAIDRDAAGLGWLQHSRYWSAYRVERPGQSGRLFIGDVGARLFDDLQDLPWSAAREPALVGASAGRWCFHLTSPIFHAGRKA